MHRIHWFFFAVLFAACDEPQTGDTGPMADDTAFPADTGSLETWCRGDGDGRISFDEFVADPAAGVQAICTVNAPGSVVTVPDLAGVEVMGGERHWDFRDTAGASDEQWTVGLRGLQGTWFADEFPTATYYVGLDASEETYGIYQRDEAQERLLLLGMASAQQGVTLLKYAQPIVVFEFPLVLDKHWETVGVQADGVFEGTEYPADYGYLGTVTLHHTYRFLVDSQGTADVPTGTFPALRLRLDQETEAVNSISGTFASTSQIAYFFISECTGLVARVRSQDGETNANYERASEFLRLGF